MTITWPRLPRSGPEVMGSKPLKLANSKALSQQVGKASLHWLTMGKKSNPETVEGPRALTLWIAYSTSPLRYALGTASQRGPSLSY